MFPSHDPALNGRHPEFAHQSRFPGIGVTYVREVLGPVVARYARSESDIPVTLRHGGKEWPLGRTLIRELKKYLYKGEIPKRSSWDALQDVPEIAAFLESQAADLVSSSQEKLKALKEFLIQYELMRRSAAAAQFELDKQRIANLKSREGIFKKRGSI